MSASSAPFPSPDLVRLLLCQLDLYEAVLDSSGWDEARTNAILKTFMSSMLALMRVQQSLGGQLLTAQHEMIQRYRAQLEMWLKEQGQAAERPAHAPTDRGPAR